MRTMPVYATPKSAVIPRLVHSLYLSNIHANGNMEFAADYAAEKFRDTPEVGFVLKAAVDAIDSTVSLGRLSITNTLLDPLRDRSVVDRLLPRAVRVPFTLKVPHITAQTGGAWIRADGGPIPAGNPTFGSTALPTTKLGSMTIMTDDLGKFAVPGADSTLGNLLTSGLGRFYDQQFLTSGIAAVTNEKPAAITNGASLVSSTGSTAAAVTADLASMAAALGSWLDPVWVMLPKTLCKLASLNTGFLTWTGQQAYIFGFPVFTSLGSPSQIALIDIGSILIASEDVEISTTREATIEMSDTPLAGDTSPISSNVLKSLWQNNLFAIKVLRWINWQRPQTSSVVYMVTAY